MCKSIILLSLFFVTVHCGLLDGLLEEKKGLDNTVNNGITALDKQAEPVVGGLTGLLGKKEDGEVKKPEEATTAKPETVEEKKEPKIEEAKAETKPEKVEEKKESKTEEAKPETTTSKTPEAPKPTEPVKTVQK